MKKIVLTIIAVFCTVSLCGCQKEPAPTPLPAQQEETVTVPASTAPEVIRNYIELRGIGVIDVRHMFGISAVKESQTIDLIVNLELWRDNCAYDRLGLEEHYTTLLDVQVPTVTIPVKPGRNLSIIIEVAAMNNRQKKMGFNAAKAFTEQLDAHFGLGTE